jgi:hypothetical protein
MLTGRRRDDMLTVYKYPFSIADDFKMSFPKGVRLLCVQTQQEKPCLWALVDPDVEPTVVVKFHLAGTGHPIDIPAQNLSYFDTFQMYDGSLVFHLFIVNDGTNPNIEKGEIK